MNWAVLCRNWFERLKNWWERGQRCFIWNQKYTLKIYDFTEFQYFFWCFFSFFWARNFGLLKFNKDIQMSSRFVEILFFIEILLGPLGPQTLVLHGDIFILTWCLWCCRIWQDPTWGTHRATWWWSHSWWSVSALSRSCQQCDIKQVEDSRWQHHEGLQWAEHCNQLDNLSASPLTAKDKKNNYFFHYKSFNLWTLSLLKWFLF